MRRFVTSVLFLFFAIPFGASISGCHHAAAPTYCNGENSGVEVGQLTTLNLGPRLTGISINQGEIAQTGTPSGTDCKGNSASAGTVTYSTSNITIADVQPTTGRLCGGSWNRNSGGGIADFTYCTATAQSGIAYLTASAGGVVSNPIPIFVHPVVTSVILGPASTNCITDPASNCLYDATQPNGCSTANPSANLPAGISAYTGTSCISQGFATQLVARTYAAVPPFAITSYSIAGNIATFQTSTQRLVAGETVTLSGFPNSTFLNGQVVTVLAAGLTTTAFEGQVTGPATVAATTETGTGTGPTTGVNNISCLAGPLTFTATSTSGAGTSSGVVTIDNTQTIPGLATAAQPGSATIIASVSQASSSAGFFATCPPKSIVFSNPGSTTAPTTPVTVDQNSTATFVTTVTDTNGNPITNIPLSYISTTPTTLPIASNTITPPFPGAAAITAVCVPPNCNSAPFNEIGLFGTGTPITSNPIQINAVGTNFNTILYMASSNSQYLLPFDFTLSVQSAPIRLPYAPNSFQLSTDLTTIYMGTPNEIMIFGTGSNTLTKEDPQLSGTVLSVSPDSSTVIVTDPVRQLIYLYSSSSSIIAEYGGVAVSASWTPDSQTVYIPTTDGRLLVYSKFTGWTVIPLSTPATNVAVTVPSAGIYMAQNQSTSQASSIDVRTNCPATTTVGTGLNQTTTNVFYPDLGPVTVPATSVAATNDGAHILAATPGYAATGGTPAVSPTFTDITTNQKSGACPVTFTSTPGKSIGLGVTPTTVNQLLTTSDSAYAFITYSGGTSSTVPYYSPSNPPAGQTLPQIQLSGANPGNPITGVISADNNTFYVTGSIDGLVHRLTRGATGFTDSTTPINPLLPAISGSGATSGSGYAIPNFLAQKPRKSTT